MSKVIFTSLLTFVGMLGLFNVTSAQHSEHMRMPLADSGISRAVAVLSPTQGSNVTGLVTFSRTDKGIKVVAHIEGLTPGKHGFHIHQYGDCSSPDGSSAGGHFNPEMKPHGAPQDVNRHAGDIGNIEADSSGIAHLEWIDPKMAFAGPNSIIGRAVIVHANPDDFTTQPTGNAGPRVACGVIGIAK